MFSESNKEVVFKITDDSGFLAIANPQTYSSFIDENWQLSQLITHFIDEMNRDTLIVWSTGSLDVWNVLFSDKSSDKDSFREFSKTITVTGGELCLTNYEDLSMAAQFEDCKIPAEHNSELLIKLENGKHLFTVRQMFDPNNYDYDLQETVNFEIIIQAIKNYKYPKSNSVFWWTE